MGGEFSEAVRGRVCQAWSALDAATGAEDAYEVALAQDELDDALRVAREHDIEVDRCAQTSADANEDE